MSAYIDTSALAKCYIREPRSLEVLDWTEAQDEVTTSPLTLVEFRRMLARRRRTRQIDAPLERVALAKFDRDVQTRSWRIYHGADSLYTEAPQLIDLIPELPLRALDALHLAYARHYGVDSFATADKNQAEAAKALGILVIVFY